MPKMKNKQVAKYKHKSGSEKLKIRLQNQLKTAAMDKGQTKLNFNSFAVAIPDEVVNTPNTLPSSSSGHHSFSAGVEDDACNATPSHYHDTDNDMITNASSESDSESGLNLPEQPDAQDDTDTDGDEDEGTCDDLAAELAHDQPSSLGLHTVGNFISPNMADPLGVKLFFWENHPIQPPPTACNLPFNSTKIYFRDITGSDPVQRKWLSYAHHNRSIYCSVCMAFGEQRDSAFVSGVKVDVKSIYNKVNKHEISDSHRCAVDAYLRVDKHKSLDVLLKSKRLQEVEKNRLVLSRIIDIILTLAKQNMAFRAYRFEAAHHIKMEEPAGCRNQGNFLELVKLVAKYDPILKAHVQQSIFKSQIMLNKREKTKSVCTKAGRGNLLTFLSKTTVNNIIKIVGKEISASVAKDVILAKEFSLEVDSTQDVSVTDQLSVCVRYVLNGEVNERLIKMLAQHSSTGEAQYNLLKAELGHLGIDLKNLVSDSFDGAANMKGAYKGLQRILKRDAPNSVFTHCHAHVLNLVIGDTTMCVISAQDLFDLIQKTAVFFSYSYKRIDLWKRIVSNSDAHEKQRRLQKLGATRWNSKHTALQGIFETTSTPNEERTRYVHLVEALHTLGYHEAVDPATATEARNYLGKWTSFDTILTSFIFLHIFEASTPVSKYFQTKGLDYIAAWNQVVALRESIHLLSGKFDDIFKEAEEFVNAMMLKTEDLENVVITSTLAEKRKRSKKLMPGEVARDESVDLDTKTRYRVDTFVATMDQIQSSLKRRFEDNEDLMKSFAYIDPRRFQDVRSGALSLQDKNAVDALKRIASLAKVDHEQLVRELKEFASSYDSLSLALHAEFKERSEVEKNPISIFLDDDCEDDNSENDTNVNLGLTQEQQQAYACVDYMVRGSSLLKVRPNSRQYHRFFTLSEDMTTIRWTPTTKKTSKAMVQIGSIKEIRVGKNTEVLRARDLSGAYTEDCAFSILYGEDFESLDLVASSAEEANIWVTGLNALLGAHKSPDGLEEKQALRERWLQEEFQQVANGKSGCLDQCTAIDLIQKLSGSGHVTTVRIKQKLAEFDQTKLDGRRGTIDSKEFVDMFKEITTRPEVYFLLIRFANKDYLNMEDLQLFLEGEQGMLDLTPEKCTKIIQQFEPTPEARDNCQLLIDGFTKYLLSEECDIFEASHRDVCQDMQQPLSHYFISSSHNTYLLEDQLKGPSSVEGLIRALGNGCRCVKVDCWDGAEEPIVYHGNTLTSKISFRDCVEVIKEFAFVYSQYPLIVHLENHCGLEQQRVTAQILKSILQHMLYIHKEDGLRDVSEMSPHELRGKIIIMGKRLPLDRRKDVGEVTDEDEGMETSKRKEKPRKVPLCRDLSDLVSLVRLRFIDFGTSKQIQTPQEMCSMNESTAGKLAHSSPDEFVNHNKTYLTRVFPNASRVDSSNYNPQDFWNCGCQLVALNFQTPGQMMDLYDGRFRQNGGCGYVLKPSIMREHLAFFSATAKELMPGVSPQTLHLKVISGQHLPRPRGSTAKGDVIDPYVVVQLYGIPADCTERRTRAVSNEGDCPIFEESFEFQVLLPELVVLRFVVLDDDYIGDDFIGQYTIPFECMLTGYRHIRLLTNTGEPLENSTLFVHVAISNRKGGGKPPKKKSKSDKLYADIRMVGIKQIDDILKSTSPSLSEALKVRHDTEQAMHDLRAECGLSHAANMKQCLRVLLHRISGSPQIHNIAIQIQQGLPMLKVDAENMPPHLHRSIVTFEHTMIELQYMIDNADRLKEQIQSKLTSVLEFYEELPTLGSQAGIKGKKFNRMQENYTWNIRTLRGQVDLLVSCKEECHRAIAQVLSSAATVGSYASRDRSPSVARSQRQLTLHCRRTSTEITPLGAQGRSPTSPAPVSPLTDIKPKSILKKSNSNIEQGSAGYVRLSPTSSSLRSNSWDAESNVGNKNS